jgi:hypothetical protein
LAGERSRRKFMTSHFALAELRRTANPFLRWATAHQHEFYWQARASERTITCSS